MSEKNTLTKDNIRLVPDEPFFLDADENGEYFLNSTYELHFDTFAYFGEPKTSEDSSEYIDFYTDYLGDGSLRAYYTVVYEDGKEKHTDVSLSKEETSLLMDILNEGAAKEGYKGIADMLAQMSKEEVER